MCDCDNNVAQSLTDALIAATHADLCVRVCVCHKHNTLPRPCRIRGGFTDACDHIASKYTKNQKEVTQ